MELKRYSDPKEFRAKVLDFLLENEAQNCVLIGVIDPLIQNPEAYPNYRFWAVLSNDKVLGAAWMTPPFPLGLTAMPDAAVEILVAEARTLRDKPKAVAGPKAQADLFNVLWLQTNPKTQSHAMNMRIFQLYQVTNRYTVAGQIRLADENDLKLIVDWTRRFLIDCGLVGEVDRAEENARFAVQKKSRYVWTVDGEAVAMVGALGPTPSGIRIGYVYTPDILRGKGYATAVVAAVTQKMLDEGKKFCFLYTDLANPTSNSIYQKMGYQPVCDTAHHTFSI